jgi:hypothetical protein
MGSSSPEEGAERTGESSRSGAADPAKKVCSRDDIRWEKSFISVAI